jgi:hypothetical protein
VVVVRVRKHRKDAHVGARPSLIDDQCAASSGGWTESRCCAAWGLGPRAHQGAARCGMRWYEAVRVGHSGHRWSQNRRPKRARTCLFWQDYCLLWQLKGNFAASHGCHRWSQRSQMVPDGHRWSQLVTESARAGCARGPNPLFTRSGKIESHMSKEKKKLCSFSHASEAS